MEFNTTFVDMKVTIKNYPQTFSFETDKIFPKFDPENGCELRDELLLVKMYELEIDSPCHAENK